MPRAATKAKVVQLRPQPKPRHHVQREWEYVAELQHEFRPDQWRCRKRRLYVDIDNALPKLFQWLMRHGKVGDVVQVSNLHTGKWVGELKLTLEGHIEADYCWISTFPDK